MDYSGICNVGYYGHWNSKCAIDNGFRVPEDISIIGFDGIEQAMFYNPTITTVKQPSVDIAKSVDLLIKSIRNKKFSQHLTLPAKLVKVILLN